MTKALRLSLIIPIYNRPDEMYELLQSLSRQTDKDFELWIIEDGSSLDCEAVVKEFQTQFQHLAYHKQANTGPAYARNAGMKLAGGDYFIFLDSDCIIPSHYIDSVKKELQDHYTDGFGGADAAHDSFTDLQKAINYTMTSWLTTGGIRGKEKAVSKFQPRSFNMGISRAVFQKTGGFGRIFPGEDPDLSLRMWEAGFETRFFPQSFVYHKRRISYTKFAHQVYGFGKVRPMLNYFHPQYAKMSFWFPSLFLIGSFFAFLWTILNISCTINILFYLPLLLLCFYVFAILIDSSIQNKSVKIGFQSVICLFIQFYNYGWAFLHTWIVINILQRNPEEAFPENFKPIT